LSNVGFSQGDGITLVGYVGFQAAVNYAAGSGFLAVGDFNGDGRPDLATANSSNGITVLLGDGDGTSTRR
jgi:hypothetical protein